MFQSLFWWNVVTYADITPEGENRGAFQSLFWWNVVTYRLAAPRRGDRGLVSILVLVECSYLQGGDQSLPGGGRGFNPCSGGM